MGLRSIQVKCELCSLKPRQIRPFQIADPLHKIAHRKLTK